MDDDVRELLTTGRNFAHLSTLMADGSPHSVVVWIAMEGDRVVFFTQPRSLKARNVARDPRVALSIVDHEKPYRTARVRGRVVATREGDAALEVMDRMAQRYTGADFPMRSGVLYEIEAEKSGFTELPFRHEPETGAP
jgi:PPOX class probable F420-dependent enzyme